MSAGVGNVKLAKSIAVWRNKTTLFVSFKQDLSHTMKMSGIPIHYFYT